MLQYIALIPLDLGNGKKAIPGERVDVSKWSGAAILAHEGFRHIKQVFGPVHEKAEVQEVKETNKHMDESAAAENKKAAKSKKKVSKAPVTV